MKNFYSMAKEQMNLTLGPRDFERFTHLTEDHDGSQSQSENAFGVYYKVIGEMIAGTDEGRPRAIEVVIVGRPLPKEEQAEK